MYTLDRFARNRYDSAIYKAKLKKNGVRVYYAKQPMPDTPEGIILESVLEGYAEYYSENLARNIKRGIRENALQGLATGGANLLLGYTVGEDRKYAIDPTGAKIVQEIFQLYADGMSATQIIAYCNERGYKTARGNAFNKNSLRTILRNEKYTGIYKLMDIVIPDGMPAIIDKVLFEKVQAMLKHNGKARAKAKAHENYLLTTKLFCGHCGSPMVGESGTSKTGQVHYYYKCTKAKREHACKKKSERKDWIEKLVVRYTVQNVLTDENIALIAKRAMEIIEKESADTTYLDGLNAELKDVQKKIKNLVSAIEQGIITSATKDRLDELEQEKSDIEGRIAREEMKKPLLNESRIRYWLTSFKSGNVDDEDYQRRVIDTLVNSVYVYDDEDGGKRIVLTFNLSGNNTATLTSSDIECYAPPAQRKTSNPLRLLVFLCLSMLFGALRGISLPANIETASCLCYKNSQNSESGEPCKFVRLLPFHDNSKKSCSPPQFPFSHLCAKMRKELKRRHLRVIICKAYRSSKMFTCVKSQKARKAKLIKAIFRLTPDTCITTHRSKGVTVIENRRFHCSNGNYRSRRGREFELHFI